MIKTGKPHGKQVLAANRKSGKYRVFVNKDTYMIARDDLVALLDEHGHKIQIIGAESFVFDGKYITPVMECIFDASDASPQEAITGLRRLITENNDWKTKPTFIELILA